VYVKVDLCNASDGRLYIQPSGVVQVEAAVQFADAQCFTSLDGASYVLTGSLQTPVTLEPTWTGGAFSTAQPAAEDLAGVVHLSGGLSSSSDGVFEEFVLPPQLRPGKAVVLPISLCDGANGGMSITTDGVAVVYGVGLNHTGPACFTSPDGVTFAR